MISEYYIYILTNKKDGALYVGMTNNLKKRIEEHKAGNGSIFTSRYNIDKLLYFEIFTDPEHAIKREKQLKAGSRKNKIDLFEQKNPNWSDIYLAI